jgi:hypothetical protein
VIKLLQNFRFRFTSKQQVLGDFFELMLNHWDTLFFHLVMK